jgi:2'-hydroxyisoflavone reductase
MPTFRRTFRRLAAVSGGALGLDLTTMPDAFAASATVPHTQPRTTRLRILTPGGTGFIGPYQVRYALDRGHTLTLFNRGQTNPQRVPTVERLKGASASDLTSLEGRDWDVVIDNSANDPAWVERSAGLLEPRVTQHMFVSTRSVYLDSSRGPMTIHAPVFTRENTPVAAGDARSYARFKALAEKEAQGYFPSRSTVVRPCLIVDPGDGNDPVQVIEAREAEVLAAWHARAQ